MSRRYLPAIGLIVGLAPAMAHAQTNIDEGKSAAQIFSSDCNVCHKSASGLAKGRNTSGIAEYLRQHYTTGREQAASLAAYILGAGAGGGPAGKPTIERASKPSEEAAKPSSKQARRPPKGEEAPGRAAKLQPPKGEEEEETIPPANVPISVEEPAPKPSEKEKPAARARKGEPKPIAKRGRHPEPAEPPAREKPTVAAGTPAAVEPAATAPATPAAAAVPPAEPGETVPRDNIPD